MNLLQELIQKLDSLKSAKTIFNPAIKVQIVIGQAQVWIDDISRVNGKYFCTISTLKDSCKMNVENLDENQLKALKLRIDFLKP